MNDTMSSGQVMVAAVVSLVAGLMLQIVPLHGMLASLRPDWVALILLYWCLTQPRYFGLVTAFVIGLLLDTLSGALLGQHALALVLMIYLALKFRLRIRVFPMAQMVFAVIVLLAVYQFTLFWIDGVSGRTVALEERWHPLITGALAWPVVFWLLTRADDVPDKATQL